MLATGKDSEERKKTGEALVREAQRCPKPGWKCMPLSHAWRHRLRNLSNNLQPLQSKYTTAKDFLYQKTHWVVNMEKDLWRMRTSSTMNQHGAGKQVENQEYSHVGWPSWVEACPGSSWGRNSEIHTVVTPETMATTTSSGTTKTLEILAAPSPPFLQLVTQVLIAAAGVPAQMAVAADFATPPSPPLQPVKTAAVAAARAPVAATVRAPA